jgi:hypothetical protein
MKYQPEKVLENPGIERNSAMIGYDVAPGNNNFAPEKASPPAQCSAET